MKNILVVLCFMALGCSSLLYSHNNYSSVLIYRNKAMPKDAQVIGSVGESNEHMDDLIKNLQVRARRLGGNALVFEHMEYISDAEMFHVMAIVVKVPYQGETTK